MASASPCVCPVSSPGQLAIVTGTYVYSPGPHIGFPEVPWLARIKLRVA
jgi:hypothetical protein